jgi:hypothetical protein
MSFPAIEPQVRFFRNVETDKIARAYATQPTDLQLRADDALVSELKVCGAWYDWDFFYLFATHTPQAAIINWVNPGQYNATATSAHTAHRQFAGNGSSTFVDSNFNPTTAISPKYQRDDCCFGYWLQNSGGLNSNEAGLWDGTTGTIIAARLSTNIANLRMNCTTALATAATVTTAFGLSAGDRTASNVQVFYKNGAALATGSETSDAVVSGNFLFGKVGVSFLNRAFTLGFAGRSLGATKHLAVYAAVNRRLQAFGGAP